MTTEEFSNAFDTLINSYNNKFEFGDTHSRADVSLDEYEKSLFLTEAQDQIIIELYSGRNDKLSSFEKTEELRANLRNLIKTASLDITEGDYKGLSKYSKFFKLPSDILFITYEAATINDTDAGCKDGETIVVIPVTQDEFYRAMGNPFKQANKRKALRLDNGLDIVEIVSKYNLSKYTVRYISKPTPIVLTNLSEMGVFPEVNGQETNCKLDSVLHRPILERAVLLALSSKSNQSKNS
jgi:hypothetical protein